MSDGYEILKNERSLGIFRKSDAKTKLKKIMGRRKWSSAIFPGATIYSSKKDTIEIKSVGCYTCANRNLKRRQRRKT